LLIARKSIYLPQPQGEYIDFDFVELAGKVEPGSSPPPGAGVTEEPEKIRVCSVLRSPWGRG